MLAHIMRNKRTWCELRNPRFSAALSELSVFCCRPASFLTFVADAIHVPDPRVCPPWRLLGQKHAPDASQTASLLRFRFRFPAFLAAHCPERAARGFGARSAPAGRFHRF